jgi:hypothetical protein
MFRSFSVLKSATVACGVGLGLTTLHQQTSLFPSHLKSQNSYPIFTHRIVFADKTEPKHDNHTKSNDVKENKMTDDEKWAEKGENCPLCKMALASPCVNEFKVFDTCLEKLREKYGDEKPPDDEGMECFSGFHACMFANMEFFKNYVEAREAEQSEQNEQSEQEEQEASSGDSSSEEIEQGQEQEQKNK